MLNVINAPRSLTIVFENDRDILRKGRVPANPPIRCKSFLPAGGALWLNYPCGPLNELINPLRSWASWYLYLIYNVSIQRNTRWDLGYTLKTCLVPHKRQSSSRHLVSSFLCTGQTILSECTCYQHVLSFHLCSIIRIDLKTLNIQNLFRMVNYGQFNLAFSQQKNIMLTWSLQKSIDWCKIDKEK